MKHIKNLRDENGLISFFKHFLIIEAELLH